MFNELERAVQAISAEEDTLPAVFIGRCYLGGLPKLQALMETGELESLRDEIRRDCLK